MPENDPTRPRTPSISERLKVAKSETQKFRKAVNRMKSALDRMDQAFPSPVSSEWGDLMTENAEEIEELAIEVSDYINIVHDHLAEIEKIDQTNAGMVKAARSFMLVHNEFDELRTRFHMLCTRIRMKLPRWKEIN